MKVVDLIENNKAKTVAIEEYRKIYGTGSFQISLPPEFVAAVKLTWGSYVKLELVGNKIVITNPRLLVSETTTETEAKGA